MSPDQINAEHGQPLWTCVTCKVTSGLHWWNGLSVAVCDRAECSKAFNDKCVEREAAEAAYQAHVREVWGD